MRKKYIYIVLAFIGIFVLNFTTPAHAVKSEDAQKSPAGFVYNIEYPENQKGENGYFDLAMQAGQKQIVQILLKNPSDQKQTIDVQLNSTKTNANGVLEYGPNKIEKDPSLKFDFTEIVKAPKTVTVEPNSEQKLDLEISMPETSYDGIIVGGIQLKKKDNEKEAKPKDGANIVNKYAYIIAMVLQVTDTKVEPEMKLNKVFAGQENYRNAVYIDVSNVEAAFLGNLTLEAQISREKSEEVLYETKKKEMRMAPNTKMLFPVSMQGEKMVAGKYKAHVLATSGEKKWEWTKNFTITDEEADKFNRDDMGLVQKKGIDWKLIALIAGGLIVLFLLVFGVIRVVNKKKEKKKKQNSKKKRKQSR